MRNSFILGSLLLILINILILGITPIHAQETVTKSQLNLDPKERQIASELDQRIRRLDLDKDVEVFGSSFFKIYDATSSSQFSSSLIIPPSYRLGIGDSLIVKIRGIQDEDIVTKVSNHGTVSLPKVEPLYILNKTLNEAEELIREKLLKEFKNVNILVDINGVRSFNVSITGEVKNPGSYLVTGLHKLVDLMYLCGGPTSNGSYRVVNVYHSSMNGENENPDNSTTNKDVIDLYDIFLHGNEKSNLFLQTGDRVVVPTVQRTVSMIGQVKRPARYEFTEELTLEQLVELSGGFMPGAYTKRIQIRRLTQDGFPTTSEVDFSTESGKTFNIQDGDEVYVFDSLDVLRGFVSIKGNVWYPGDYTLTENMKLSDLINNAGSCLPGTYRNRVDILRFISSNQRKTIQVPLEENYLPADKNDLILEEWDIVKVYEETDVIPLKIATIEGAIDNPGNYPIREDMKVLDLVIEAGGLTHYANTRRAEMLRINNEGQTIKLEIDLEKINSDPNATENIPLMKDDKLIILEREDMYALNTAMVTGEIKKPGSYQIAQGEKLNNFILKAGGLKEDAYPAKAELFRVDDEGNLTHQMINLTKALNDPLSEDNIVIQDNDRLNILTTNPLDAGWHASIAGEVKNASTYPIVQGTRIKDLLMKAGGLTQNAYSVTAELSRYENSNVVKISQIDLWDILKNPDSKANLLLKDLDHLRIFKDPSKTQTITVNINGQVHLPGSFTLTEETKLSQLLDRAGGLREKGYLKGLVLVRNSLQQKEDTLINNLQQSQERELLRLQSTLAEGAVTNEEKQLQLKILEMRKRIIALTENRYIKGRLIFDPENDDPILEDGDSITIPPTPNSITILGSVYASGSIIYNEKMTYNECLNKVGGMTPYADENQTYIIEPTGYINRSIDDSSIILPGSVIVVPPKLEAELLAGEND